MKRLKAQEAIYLAGPTPDEIIDSVMPYIESAAKEKNRMLKPHSVDKGNFEFWVNEGYKPTDKWKKVKSILEGLGYKVEFYYVERQFVDMYTIIHW